MQIVERIQFMHQPLRMHPAQRMPADVELPRIIAQDYGIAQEFVRLNAAPQRALGGDPDWIGRDFQRGEAEPVEMRQPCGLISEPPLWSRCKEGDGGSRQALLAQT